LISNTNNREYFINTKQFGWHISFLQYYFIYEEVELSDPIEGEEGTNITFYCILSRLGLLAWTGLRVEVNGNSLLSSRTRTSTINSTHLKITVYNLDRRPFVNLNLPGDNGMPLYCITSTTRLRSKEVRMEVFCKCKR